MANRTLMAFFLVTCASFANSADGPMPWAFVNGSAEGYSIKLVSALPAPGTPLTVGQTVEFKITVSYELSVKANGAIILVVQDEANKNLLGDRKQQNQPVSRGKGTVTMTESFVVPAGQNEVRLFIPLVPNGISNTSGELVLRYPVSDTVKSSPIGYPSVAAALNDLRSKADVKFSEQNGWTIANDSDHMTIWSFAPEGDPAYPSAVKRVLEQVSRGSKVDSSIQMSVLCQSTQIACDKMVADFTAMNEQFLNSAKRK